MGSRNRYQRFTAVIQQWPISRVPPQIGRGDWDACTTLRTDILAKIVMLRTILIGTLQLAPEIVFDRILRGLSLTLFVGLGTFAYLGIRLAHGP